MIYWQYWSSFWSSLAQGTHRLESRSAPSSRQLAAPEKAPEGVSPEEKYHYLTQYGTQALCLLAPGGQCNYASSNLETITGHAPETLVAEGLLSLMQDDFRERFAQLLAQPTPPSHPHQFRCKLRHADGKHYWYMLLLHSRPEGESVCVLENVHDTMVIQNTLQKARLEAELALRARSEFLANMSHDLRTPLNAVIGFAQIMENQIFGKIENPQYLEYAKHIQESGYDLLSKIEDLLEIANIDAGRVSLDRSTAKLADIMRQVCEAQQHHAQSAKVALEYQPLDGDALLYVDRLKLQHILGHLLNNAIKHSPAGSRISISSAVTEKNELSLRIHDQGSGIAPAKLADIMETLQQEHCWTAKNNQHIGIGLALAKEFVSLHNGALHITSKPQQGTTVQLTLPADCIRSHQSQREHEYIQAAG